MNNTFVRLIDETQTRASSYQIRSMTQHNEEPTGTQDNAIPARFKTTLTIVLGLPLLISVIFTSAQLYPATYAIDWLTNEEGEFSLKAAIILNFVLMMLPLLIMLLIAVLLKKLMNKH